MEQEISEKQREALDQFGFRSAVPLFRRTDESADHLATGIFIAVGCRVFLLTARHILDKCKPEDVAIATSPEGSALQTLGNLVVHKPIDVPGADIDIVAIELLDDETKRIIYDGWRVIDPSMGGDAYGTGELVLIGYPSETLKMEGINIKGGPTGIITAPLALTPSNANPTANPALDFFLQLPRRAVVVGGQVVEIPAIQGMSGCAIWELREVAEGALWSPDRALRFVGIQSSAKPGHYFRGKRWSFVKAMLDQA